MTNNEPHTHTDEHASILSQVAQIAEVTHTRRNGACDHEGVGGEDGPECGADGSKLGVDHLKLPECDHKGTAQLTKRNRNKKKK